MDAFVISVPALPSQVGESTSAIRAAMAQNGPGRKLALDNSWAPLHFVLTGEFPIPRQKAEELGMSWNNDSLENAIMGGAATEVASSYGPVRYLSPAEVRRIARQLDGISPAEIKARTNPQELEQEGVLPEDWDAATAPDKLMALFSELRSFYHHAAERGDAILLYMV